ncbi:MAG: hypothetical protein PHO62_00590 [Sulfurimonas sp.]|uniref:hypothetical protein n=1 Tax=Sulfurimonas sp. TaxID=2022749 RepID=UPI002638FD6B|nr:hypothetical protein [Sulfurimonas sp.]MDD5371904.1 hypothetical protein [Sulfurimonas sp.]
MFLRVAVECKSPLMQKSLELFLGKYLSSAKNCDILLRDVKCMNDKRCFYISSSKDADLVKPFSKSQLILALEKRYGSVNETDRKSEFADDEKLDFEILEKRIESLTKEYQANILRAVRAFYEK